MAVVPSNTTIGQLEAGTHPLRGIRRRSATVMAQAWSTIPHITCLDEVDATALANARDQLRAAADPALAAALTFTPFLVAAVAHALRAFPAVNASIAADAASVTVHEHVNVGVAVATDNGLVVPVVRDAERLRLGDLAREIARLTSAARAGSVTPADIGGGTATVTNYGALGGRFATPLIRPPEVVIVGFGAIRPRPIVVDDEVRARRTLPISISCDHRVIDGDLATAFLERVKSLVAAPILLTGAI
jgi:pyruvate/2-oxoglutarate dehydrogenase complex dihydrolipoamide acyltransferase (E2) component